MWLSDYKEYVKINDMSKSREEQDDSEALIGELKKQKMNGNIDKAYQLGAILAAEVENNDGEFIFGLDEDSESTHTVILQRRLLLAFTVDLGTSIYCPNSIVARTALNCFFDTIKANSPHIYDDIRESAAFSYYFLCVRDNDNPQKSIGQRFAKLVGQKGDPIYEELGVALYLHFLDIISNKVKVLNFITD